MTDHPPPGGRSPTTVIGRRDFDNHIYTSVMDDHEEAFDLVFNILNNYENEPKLIDASMRGDPAVQGISDIIHNEQLLFDILTNKRDRGFSSNCRGQIPQNLRSCRERENGGFRLATTPAKTSEASPTIIWKVHNL